MSIKINDLTYIYSKGTPYEKKAINNISLEIKKGEFIGLIGHTGSGKSTLIQHLNGLLTPTSGQVIINEQNIHSKNIKLKDIRQTIGLVFQYPEHQLFEISVYKDIAFGPTNMGLSSKEIDSRVRESLSAVGLNEDILEKSPFELSGGQKRRVAIAGVLAMQPEILILDEPTAGLDPRGRDQILDEIDQLHKKWNITIILVSHSMEDIAKYVDRIIVMEHGNIELDGEPKEVFRNLEQLEKIGLGVPQVTYLMNELKKAGFNVSDKITTLKEAEEEIMKILKKDVAT